MEMDNQNFTLLLVDDEPDILEFLSYNLKKEGFKVHLADTGQKAIERAKELQPHLILLDVMMPEMDGIETCEKLRELTFTQDPIIAFLTARGEDYSQISGFEAGGDDYITKPIKPKVLVSRIKALLKRHHKTTEQSSVNQITVGEISIDLEKYQITKAGTEISLPKKEFKLLVLLASKPSKVFTREEIYSKVWGEDVFVGDRTIDVHIRKLREKIGDEYIKTVKGVGYKFNI